MLMKRTARVRRNLKLGDRPGCWRVTIATGVLGWPSVAPKVEGLGRQGKRQRLGLYPSLYHQIRSCPKIVAASVFQSRSEAMGRLKKGT